MRTGLLVAVAGLLAAGCASTKPCMTIPAQVELAQDMKDAARESYETKRAENQRWVTNLDQSTNKVARLQEELDQLMKEAGGAGLDTGEAPKEEVKK
jgi:uncharacterized protein YcfL